MTTAAPGPDSVHGAESAGRETVGPVLARLAQPTTEETTRIAVVADPHVTPTAEGTWKVYHRTEARFRAAIDVVNDLGPDATLFLGDLTKDGAPAEFALVDEILSGLTSPAVAVPGNHDVPKQWDEYETPTVDSFGDRYGRGRYPFRVAVGGLDLVCLDSATGDGDLRDTHVGRVSEAQLDWLDDTLDTPTDARTTRTPVVALHHNLLHARRHTGEFPDAAFYRLQNADALRAVLSRHGVPLVLSGHLHWPAAATRDDVRELLAPATCSFPQAVLVLDVTDGGTTVRLVPIADREGVAEAYTHARTGSAHGQGVAEHAERGYFGDLPAFVEGAASESQETDVPGSAVRWSR
ncbi:3',5'-cyclic AMP phosphodiesterase CpdA [Halogranum rubrum]|uniref:3',5'-cyclic AMP phosphodiesterase CpdA n=1 Tax=Halogranum rubrum TaxID=553466 RepID=A0A1I4ETX1_9EURY|nr:metallophosphoesterase [Halogranum rubrum]SFL09158.1 3',5'-cyclic AMP phosphodiesterase CpdA [Halogranum rubrum]